MMPPPAGFFVPDFSAPVDVERARARTPPTATTKGMYFSGLLDERRRAGVATDGQPSYVPFRDYPSTEYLDLLIDTARMVYPTDALGEALRRIGRLAYPALVSSLVGRVIFGILGADVHAITRLVPRAYELSGKPARAEVVALGESHSHVRLTDVAAYLDVHQVGVFEGVLDACGLEGTVSVWHPSDTIVELFTIWRSRPATGGAVR